MTKNNVIEIYSVPLGVNRTQRDRHSRILNSEEKFRAARFKFDRDRVRWMSSRAALRLILGQHLNMSATDLNFELRSGGKPEVAIPDSCRPFTETIPASGNERPLPLEFSLSHSHDRALIAVSDTLEVGCDVEHTGRINDWPAVARRFFSTAEQQELAQVNTDLQSLAFFLCWTRKEAVIKATGEGLRADLSAFDVSLTPGSTTAVKSDRRPENSNTVWHLHNIQLDDGYVGAVATRSDQAPRINYNDNWHFDDHAV